MSKKNDRNTKGKIINAAWNLFYEQGYDDTTVEEIIEASGTSKGSFYHILRAKMLFWVLFLIYLMKNMKSFRTAFLMV